MRDMKQLFKYILVGLSLLAIPKMAGAQAVNREGGVATIKAVSDQGEDGNYTIKLETWAEGETIVQEVTKPLDVVLVLDVSGSMDFPKGPVTEVTRNFSYNDIANSGEYTYFYRDNNNRYWKVYPRTYEVSDNWGRTTTYYYLGYYPGATDPTDRRISKWGARADSNLGRITLYRGTESRMDALKTAVGKFIDEIDSKDQIKDEKGNITRAGHRISIIKFAGNTTNTVGNDTYDGEGGETNYSQIVMNLTNVEGNVDALKAAVNGFQSMGGTQAGYGMAHANTVLENADPTHNKVVVFFTDGDPDDNRAAIGNATDNQGAGTNAYRAKNAQGAVVYTIGMFTTSPATNGDTWRYLNYISSNYPKATVTSNGTMTAGEGSDQGYYQDASGNVSLSAIFESISQGIGQAESTVAASTQIRDVVSSSFTIPEGFDPDDVVIYSVRAKKQGTLAWDDETRQDYTPADDEADAVSAVIDEQDGNKRLVVTGFDFSKADTPENSNSGNGNWVGERYTQADGHFYAGAKLVIEFKIKSVEGATGGAGTNTNTGDSGVWVLQEDGTYKNINHYQIPHTTLPVNLVIKKTGLRSGESATFEIERVRPKNWDKDKTLEENIAAMEYNDIGKPVPGDNWENFSKVIVTNKGADKAEVTKTLVALDPYWIYRVNEDAWGWAYTVTGNSSADGTIPNTSTVEVNPFRFINTEKAGAVKHAEAVTINHFGYTIQTGEFQGKQEEHYKSSKVEHL